MRKAAKIFLLSVTVLLLGSITGCGFQTAQDFSSSLPPDTEVTVEDRLQNTQWQVVELNGQPFPDDIAKPTMFINSEGIDGDMVCNEWDIWGVFIAQNGEIETDLKMISSTVGCGYGELEYEFLDAFSAATRYSFEGEMLRFWNESDDQEILFAPLEKE